MNKSTNEDMENSFFIDLQRLELIACFSGYPLIYSVVRLAAGGRKWLLSLLPFAYAVLGSLYLWLQLENFFADHTLDPLSWVMRHHYLWIWGLLATLFWIPALRKRPSWTLFHSLIFVFLLAADLFRQFSAPSAQMNRVRNDMTVYTGSVFLTLCIYGLVILLSAFNVRHVKEGAASQQLSEPFTSLIYPPHTPVDPGHVI